MNETINALLNRRSIRKFRHEQVKDEELNAVLEAGKRKDLLRLWG